MNKSYRSIWNESLGAWVAVSEIENTKGKPAGSRMEGAARKGGSIGLKATLRMIPFMLLAMGSQAFAANTNVYFNHNNDNSCVYINENGGSGNVGGIQNSAANCNPSNKATQTDHALFYKQDGKVGLTLSGPLHVTSGELGLGGANGKDSKFAIGSEKTLAEKVRNGKASIAIGASLSTPTKATGSDSLAIGNGAEGLAEQAIALGRRAVASAENAIAAGIESNAKGTNSIAIGNVSRAGVNKDGDVQDSLKNDIAIGNGSVAYGGSTVALGNDANTGGLSAIAIGDGTVASGERAIGMGNGAKATGGYAMAFGVASRSTALRTIAQGASAEATKDDAVAIGNTTMATNTKATAVGAGVHATGLNSSAFGAGASATHMEALAVGFEAQAVGYRTVAVGHKAKTADVGNATALGDEAHAEGGKSTALGAFAHAKGNQSVAVGSGNQDGTGANAEGDQSIAIGGNVNAKGFSSIAIGGDDLDKVATDNAEATQKLNDLTGVLIQAREYSNTEARGDASVAVGVRTLATGHLSTAFGTFSESKGIASVALGVGSKALKDGSVALGAGSKTEQDARYLPNATVKGLDEAGTEVGEVTYSGFAGGTRLVAGDQISVGSAGYERQIKHVAPGEVSKTSTDAINGSQLAIVIGKTQHQLQGYFHVNEGNLKGAQADGDAATNWGRIRDKAGATGLYAVAAGVNAQATGDASLAAGSNAKAMSGSAVALGDRAEALDNQGIAIGQEAKANADWDISIGRRAGLGVINMQDEGRNIAIGDGALREADAPNNNIVMGTDAARKAKGSFNVVIGTYANSPTGLVGIPDDVLADKTKVDASNTVALGDRAIAYTSSSVGIGSRTKALGRITNAIGASAEARGNYSIAQGYAATATGISSIAIGSAQNVAGKTQATANYAVAVGSVNTQATGISSLALGHGAQASGSNSIAQGKSAIADMENNIAIGNTAQATTKTGAIAIGKDSTSSGSGSVALGLNSNATNSSVVAVGNNSNAIGENSVAIGNKANAQGSGNVVLGTNAGKAKTLTGSETAIIGNDTVLLGTDAGSEADNNQAQVAIGWRAGRQAVGTYNIAAGFEAGQNVNGTSNIAIGEKAGQAAENEVLNVQRTIAIGQMAKGSAGDAIAIGTNSKTDTYSTSAIAIGNGATVASNSATDTAKDSVAIGFNSKTTASSNVALGSKAKADGKSQATAIGYESVARGYQSIAMGSNTVADAGGTVVIGRKAAATNAAGNAVSLGDGANTSASQALAAGSYAKASANKGVALGAESVADRAALTNVTTNATAMAANNTVYANDAASDADKAAVSATVVGNAGAVSVGGTYQYTNSNNVQQTGTNNRQITHVAAGSEDTDAVNVAQLKAVANSIKNANSVHYYSVNDNGTAGANYDNDEAKGLNSIAAGVGASTTDTSENAIALGKDAAASLADGVAIGSMSKTEVDKGVEGADPLSAAADKTGKVWTSTRAAVSVGDVAGDITRQITGVAAGTNDTDAVNVAQLKTVAEHTKNVGNSLVSKLGGNAAINDQGQGTISMSDIGGTGVDNIDAAIRKVNETANAGWSLTAQGQHGSNVAPKGKVDLSSADNNIVVSKEAAANNVTFKLAGDINIENTVTAGTGDNAVAIGNGTVKVGNQTYIDNAGLNANDKAIRNVAAGKQDKDAVNVSQLTPLARALGMQFDSNTGAASEPSFVVGQADGGKYPAVNTIQGALDNVATEIKKPLTFSGDDVSKDFNRVLGTKINLKGGADEAKLSNSNIGVVSNGTDRLDIKLSKELSGLTSAAFTDDAGNSTSVGVDGVVITPVNSSGKTPVRLTSNGLDNGNNVITNVADGQVAANSKDAVNGGQLHLVKNKLDETAAEVEKGLNFAGNTGKANRKMGTTVTVKGELAESTAASGSNIRTTVDNEGNINILLADSPTFTGKVSAKGLDAGGKKITGVQTGSDDTDAVNVEQLRTAVNNAAITTQNVIHANSPVAYVNSNGDMLTRHVEADGTVKFTKVSDNSDYDGKDISVSVLNANSPQSAIPTVLGNLADGKKDNDAVNVSQLKDAVGALGGGASVKEDGSIQAPVYNITKNNGGQATAGNVGEALTLLNNEINNPLSFVGDNNTETVTRKLGEKLAIKGGAAQNNLTDNNIGVTGDPADGSLTIKLAKNIDLGEEGSVQTGKTQVNNDGIAITPTEAGKEPVKLTSDGLNNGGNVIANVGKGKDGKDAVNVSQLSSLAEVLGTNIDSTTGEISKPSLVVTKADGSKYDGAQTLQDALNNIGEEIQKPISFAGNSGEVSHKLGEKMTIKGSLADDATASDRNIRTKVGNDGVMAIELAESPKFGEITVNDSGKITGVAEGNVAENSKDTVTGSQLYKQGKGVASIIGGNTTYNAADGTYANNNIGGTGKDNIHEAIESVRSTANAGWNLTAEGNNSSKVAAGETVDLNSADKNIVISKTADSDSVTFDLADNIKVDSAIAGDTVLDKAGVKVGDNTALTSDGLTVKDAVSGKTVKLTANGLDNGNNVVANVAAGKNNTDAVNVSQLKPMVQALGMNVDPNNGTVSAPLFVVSKVDGTSYDGVNTVQAALNHIGTEIRRPIHFNGNIGNVSRKGDETLNIQGGLSDSAAASDRNIRTKIDGETMAIELAEAPRFGNITINDNGKISGVEAATVAAGSKEAVNGAQLYKQGKGVESIIGGQTVYNPDNGTYANADIGGTGADNVNDAIAAVRDSATAGWNLTAQGENGSNVAPTDTVDLNNKDSNIVITKKADSDDVTFDLAKTIKVESLTAGDTTVNNEGVKVGDNTALTSGGLTIKDAASGQTVSLTDKGLNNGGKVISGVANGLVAQGSQEAVNGDQLFAVEQKAVANTEVLSRGFDFAGNSGNFNRKLGERVTVKGGLDNTVAASDTNIRTVADSTGNIQVLLADAPTFKGKLTAQGLDAGGQKITGVKDGEDAGDAVNIAQLQRALINQAITQQSLVQANSPFSYVNSKGEVLARVVDDKGNEHFVKVEDDSEYTEKDITISALNPIDPQTAVPTVVGNIADGKKANDAVNVSQLKNVVKSLGGGAEVNPDGSIKDPVYNITKNNGGNATVNNIGDALGLLNDEINKPLVFVGDNNTVKVARKLDTELAVKGGATGKLTDNNIGVTGNADDNSLEVKLAENINLGKDGSVTTGQTVLNNDGVKVGGNVALTSDGLKAGDVNITYAGIDAGNKKITGVKAGENATDAVNKAQLDAVQAAASNKVTVGKNLTAKEVKNADGSLTYNVATADDVVFDSIVAGKGDNQVLLNNKGVNVGGNTYLSDKGVNANNKKVANVAKGDIAEDSTDAVNGSQLYQTADSVAKLLGGNAKVSPQGSLNMTDIGGTGANNINDAIQSLSRSVAGAKVTVAAGDNIVVDKTVKAGGATDYVVSTAKDLKVDSVTAGNTVLNDNGLAITNGPSVTVNGLNAGDKKVTNVANGEVSATSKDAVNGSQLYQAYQVLGGNNTSINTKDAPANNSSNGNATPAGTVTTVVTNADGSQTTTTETNQKIAVSTDKGGNEYTLTTYNVEGQNTYVTNDVIQAIGKMNEQGIRFFHTNDGEVKPVVQGSNQEDSSASGAYATAIGYQTSASGKGSLALGNTYTVIDRNGNTVQDSNGQAQTQRTQATGVNAIAIGSGAQANETNTIAIGTGNIVNGKNSGAIGDPSVINGENTYSVGNNNKVNSSNTFVLGNNVTKTMDNSVVLGDQSAATEIHTTAKGGNYTYAGANDANVAGVQDVKGVVSVGAEGQTRQVQNVAAGVVSQTSTDAINGSQLHHTNAAINAVGNHVVNMGNQLNQKIDDVETRSNAGTASAMAVAGLPQAYMPGKNMMAVSGSSYRGQSAYAIGYSSISDNGNWVIKGTATGNSRGHYGATAGVGYQW